MDITLIAAAALTAAEVLAAAPDSDWRALEPARTLYMELASGRVVIELAPAFAPAHVANLETLARARYFDGLAIYRVQDNFVAQWGDPDERGAFGEAKTSLAPEFTRPLRGLPAFRRLPDADTYASQAGFVQGFPVARDAKRAWLVHCYGMVGAGRGNPADSGNGAELYAVIGSAPRLLDRNVTLVGRVVQGIERLSALPRGTGKLGFYETAAERTPIRSLRLAADLPEAERGRLEILRTESTTFGRLVELRRMRRDDWYKEPAGRVDVCNVTVPVRDMPAAAGPAR